jgi:hypothetical protein
MYVQSGTAAGPAFKKTKNKNKKKKNKNIKGKIQKNERSLRIARGRQSE